MPKHAPGRPVSLPNADAANAAAPSWRMPTNTSLPAASLQRMASANPRLEWPTMPNTCVTPQLTIVSTMTSDTVRTCAGSSGTAT
jgi:hypothetical protein